MMKRIKIRSKKENKRLFDTIIDDRYEKAIIEVKQSGMKPMFISLAEFAKQVNDEMGKKIIIINTTEL